MPTANILKSNNNKKKEKKKDTPIYLSICTISFAQDLNFTPSYPEECCDLAQVKQR